MPTLPKFSDAFPETHLFFIWPKQRIVILHTKVCLSGPMIQFLLAELSLTKLTVVTLIIRTPYLIIFTNQNFLS